MIAFLSVTALVVLVGLVVCLIWSEHPSVQLRRDIRKTIEREDTATRQLDEAHSEAQARMDRTAGDWDRR